MTSRTCMLISAIVVVAILGTEGAFVPVQNSDVAAERESINSIQYNVDLYSQTQARAAIIAKKSSHETLNWTCPINESDDPSGVWYRYLNSLYCELSTYDGQVAKKSYNAADIEDWGLVDYPNLWHRPMYDIETWKNNEGKGIVIDERNFERFLEKSKVYGVAEQDKIKDMKLTELQLIELNHVLELTIKDKLDISCVEPYMYITGNNILFSHINLSISAGTVDESCRDLLVTDRLKYMNIFALNTVFIDDDIQKKFDLITVIAPKWEIHGRRTIDLNGKDAESEGTVGSTDLENVSSRRAKDGKSGNPGEPGRNFFGIGENFISGENLNISANGGDGSPGENGKNGEDGTDGLSPTTPSSSFSCKKGLCEGDKRIDHFKCKGECRESYVAPPTGGMSVYVFHGCTYEMFGEDGTPGSNAGNGGNGGEGGSHGDIVLLELNGHSGITQSKVSGSNGLNGKGGIGGVGGKRGNDIDVECRAVVNRGWSTLLTKHSNDRAASGKDGTDGRSMQTPREATRISNLHKAKTINQYKTFLRANINDPFMSYFLSNFLNRLENNPDVKSVYDILGFIDELKSLEEEFHNLYSYVNFLPFYKSLLDRISEYAKSVNDKDDKKVLAYLYTATLGRTRNVEDDLESNLIPDIAKYLELVIKDIEKLKEWQNGKVKEDITNTYKEKYKAEIDKKINDANDLISKEIIPEIGKIEQDIDKQIENLTNEVIQLQTQSRTDNLKLREKQKLLENELLLQGICGSLKILGTVVGFLGPVGAIAGSAIDIGSGLAETLLLEVPSGSDKVAGNLKKTATDLVSLKKKIDEFGNQKATELKDKLEIVSEEADKHPEFRELSANVRAIKARVTTIEQDKITIKEVQGLEMELETTLQKQKEEIKAKEGADEQKTKKRIEVIDHLQKISQLGAVTAENYNKYKKRQGKVTEIEKAIQQNEEKFVKLKKYEAEIYNTLVPMLENMESDLDNIINQINNKSKVVLDVTRWKVKSTLKDMMSHLQRVTEGFKVQGSLVRCIDRLQEAMDTLINVQDYIQDYQSDRSLANFIAGVNSVSVNDFDVSYNLMPESDLRNALRDLEIITTASIVMQRHRVAIDAFKQFVFPFAHMYFKSLLLPSHLELHNKNNPKLDDVIPQAITHIEHIKSKLDEFKISVNQYDQCSGIGEFKSNIKSTKPFFVWKNEDYSDVISRLLSGEEVIVNADLKQSSALYDAIKFNSIEFGFKAKDRKIRSELKKTLEGYKVTSTHLGNSYYQYQNNTYLITTADLTMFYSFEKNDKGEPYLRSDSYNKIKNGDFMLSPYASWKVKLLSLKNKFSFKDLEKYKDVVDFKLEGVGHYILRGERNCFDLDVNKYYKPIDDTGDSNAVDFVPLFSYNTRTRGR